MYRFQRLNTSTTTLNAQLFANETILCTQANVGLYDGKEKDLSHDNGTLYLTTHRLIYVDALRPHYNSCHLDLALVRLTEYWAGFISSSPKITLTLGESLNKPVSITPISNTVNENNLPASARAWVCRICGFSNSPAAKCTLCGVARDLGTASNPPSRASTPAPASCRSATPTSAPVPGEKRIACSICTFLNHPSMSRCEVCDSTLGNVTLPFSTQESIASPSTPAGMGFVRLSFRKGGVQAFYASLKSALVGKAWEVSGGRTNHGNTLAGESVLAKETITVGIDGILKTIDLTSQGQTTEMQDALQDLNALMLKAKEMVSLAQSLNAKLPATAPDSETSTIVKSSLVKMGLQMPALTQDMVRDEEEYHAGLARELAGLLTDQSKNNRTPLLSDEAGGRGIMPIEEIWCIWNRARGISLVSPKDFRATCPHLPTYTWPSIQLRTFASGLTVLHTHRYADSVFAARLTKHLSFLSEGLSVIEIAKLENLSVGLTTEMLESIEESTDEVCRDEQAKEGVRWYSNAILGFTWNDPN